MQPYRFHSRPVVFALGVLLAAAGHGADLTTHTVKLSDPSRPGTLKVQIVHGDLRINGADTSEISVNSEARPVATAPRRDGLRVLSSSTGFTLTEQDNVVTLESAGQEYGSRASFEVTVPRDASIVVENSWGGSVHIAGISGDLEVTGTNAEVRLDRISGGAVVQTLNGRIHAAIAQLSENRPLSFTSMNGEVLIRLPAESKANVRLRTHNGSILTDFDEDSLATKVESTLRGSPWAGTRGSAAPRTVLPPEAQEAIREASRMAVEMSREVAQALREAGSAAREGAQSARPPHAPRPPKPPTPPIPAMTGGKLVTGMLNGGGPEITVATMNGDVTLRKLEAQQ
jgi:hypothetical protein